MKKRVYTSIAIVISLVLLFVLKFYVSDFFFDAFFGAIACFAAFEMSRLLSKIGKYNYLYLSTAFPLLILAMNIGGMYIAEMKQSYFWVLYTILIDLGIVVLVTFGAFLFGLCRKKKILNEMSVREINDSVTKFAFMKALHTAVAFLYPAFLFMFFIFINHLDMMPLGRLEGIESKVSVFAVLTAFIIPMLTDTFAMLTGSVIGGKKLCPKVSPNKTISGSVGGVLWCVLFGACVYLIFGCMPAFEAFIDVFPIWAYLLIVLIGSCVAQGGDLIESVIKRRAKVSDSGKILPGHGGMLDRIDSYIFMAPYILIAFWIFAI